MTKALTAAAIRERDTIVRLTGEIERLTKRATLGRESYRAWARPRLARRSQLSLEDARQRRAMLAQIAVDERALATCTEQLSKAAERYFAERGRKLDSRIGVGFDLEAVQLRQRAGQVADGLEFRSAD